MAVTYAYKVKDRTGKVVTGSLEADSQGAVVAKLRESGLTVIKVAEASEKAGLKKEITLFKKKVKLKDITVFSRQFATMINSGLSLIKALAVLAEQTQNPTLSEIILQVKKDIESGQSLSEALAKHPKAFSRLYISMVKAGETGGVLDVVLIKVAEYYEKEIALKSKIKSAMTYPTVMAVVATLIVFAMLTFVVPVFVKMFDQLGGELPLPTKILLSISGGIRRFWYLMIVLAIGSRYGFKYFKNTDFGRLKLDQLKLRLPVFGQLNSKLSLARFTRTFGALIASGVPILQALDIVADTANNVIVSDAVRGSRSSIKEGETIAKPLSESPIFPPMVVHMVSVGEETGALDSMLIKIADFYDEEVSAMVEALTSLIEPLMIVFMGLVVGGILIALYLPMFKMITLIK
jgi:type IV pilus assembly protein PilC